MFIVLQEKYAFIFWCFGCHEFMDCFILILYLHIDVYAVQMLNILIPDYSLYFDLE